MKGPDDYDDDDFEPQSDEDEWEAECGLDEDGQCMLAGTEHCDFVCPMRDSAEFAGSAAWHEKHRVKP